MDADYLAYPRGKIFGESELAAEPYPVSREPNQSLFLREGDDAAGIHRRIDFSEARLLK